MPSNTAAWLVAARAKPLEVKPAPYTPPGENEIVVKNAAISINPLNWKLQDFAIMPLEYPHILGSDIAGTVEEVGSSVTRFKKGDRVLGHAMGLVTKKASDGAFQEYTVVHAGMVAEIPNMLAFERAVVLSLTLSTAAKGSLELEYPSLDPKPTGKTLLVWGGASAVGCNAIQLAVAAGYEVITTASPKNFEYTKKLGASQVFDYNSKSIVDEIVSALKGKTPAGVLDCIAENGAIQRCLDIVVQCEGNKFVSTVLPPPKNVPAGVGIKWIFASSINGSEVAKAIYGDFLPKALAEGKYVAAPEPYVVGKGLESVQAALEVQKRGVSAKKVVVTL